MNNRKWTMFENVTTGEILKCIIGSIGYNVMLKSDDWDELNE